MEFVFIFIALFIFRAFSRLVFKKVNSTDTYFHLYLIDFLKKNGSSSMIEKERFVRPFVLGYPWLLHLLVSFFPKRSISFFERFLNSFLDSVFCFLIFLYIYNTTGQMYPAFIGAMLYFLSPITFSNFGTGPRIWTFTPRLFGEVVGGIAFFLEYYYFVTNNPLFLLPCVALFSLLYMTSKFSVQALLFINVLLSVFLLSIVPLLVIVASLLLCLIYSKGRYLFIFKEHFSHLKAYSVESISGRLPVSERNNFYLFFDYLKRKDYKKALKHILIYNSPFILMYKATVVLWALFIVFSENYYSIAYAFLAAGLTIFVISSTKWFLFIGEAERYLNYLIVFPLIILLETGNLTHPFGLLLIVYGVLYYIADIYVLVKKTSAEGGDQNDRFITYLNALPRRINCATVPYHLGCWRIVFETNHNWWGPNVSPVDKEEAKKNDYYWIKYPFLDLSVCDEFMSDYDLDYLFVDKSKYEESVGGIALPAHVKSEYIGDGIHRLSLDKDEGSTKTL